MCYNISFCGNGPKMQQGYGDTQKKVPGNKACQITKITLNREHKAQTEPHEEICVQSWVLCAIPRAWL